MNDTTQARCLGLVGGLGVGATIHYYQELVKAHAVRGAVPHLHIVHADMGRVLGEVQAGQTARLARYLAELLQHLADAGAEVGAVSAVAPHICAPELAAISPIPLVNMLDEVRTQIHARNLHRVALFGTRFAMESKLFGQLGDVEVVALRPEEVEYIHNTYTELARSGKGNREAHRGLSELACRLTDNEGAEGIVLAGTDFSLIFNESNTEFPAVDCTQLHIEAIMSALFRTSLG